ncbi:hypothetical protein FRC14_006461 [Serendipita sp. 396]|nr:hypothetical protein FRC14_006461 [Serendipita sp. 396]
MADRRVSADGIAYDTMLLFWRIVTNLFFREIRPRGAFNIPRQGPVIFVAGPHANQFLDPLLLMSEAHRDARRRVSFLIAAKSMKRKAIGLFASLMSSIPVIRAADDAKTGKGVVYITAEQPTILYGVNTKFTLELAPKKQVMLGKALNFATAEVVEVISDTEARLKKEFGGESGKGTAKILDALKEKDAQGLDYKVMPFVDQAEMYSAVYDKLKQGGCIGIFPEGGSHDRTDFLPFKAVSLGAAPVLYSFYSVLATVVAIKAGAPMKWRIWTPFLTMAGLPILGYFALKFGEAGMDVLKSLRPLVISLIPTQDKQLDRLKAMRRELQKEVSETIEEFGPKLYEDFDDWRMIPPTSSVPASGETLGLYRRKVHTGTIDGQGSLLVHPMTWLDERLFGWSRSAKRGTSAWGGGGVSSATSRVGSPDVSDDEDHGDYDNVLGYLPSIVGDAMSGLGLSRSKTPRSLRSSFADLPSVRRAEEERARSTRRSQPPSPLLSVKQLPIHSRNSSHGNISVSFEIPQARDGSPPSPTLSTRSGGPRRRKMSLTDSVPVQRIGEIDREEPFEEATDEINKEIEEKRRSLGLQG